MNYVYQQEFEAAMSELEQTQIKVNVQNHDLTLENKSLLKDIERLQTERKAVISDLASSAVEMYGQLRKQRRGLAVTTIADSACAACGTTLTPAQQQSARSTSQLFNCPSCGKFLDVCLHSPSLDDALRTFAEFHDCGKAA